jgi:hypothetical protein
MTARPMTWTVALIAATVVSRLAEIKKGHKIPFE